MYQCVKAPPEVHEHTPWIRRYSDAAAKVLGDTPLGDLKKRAKLIKETLVLILYCREKFN